MRKTKQKKFISYLVDCVGCDEKEAEDLAVDYRNSIEDYVRDCGADDVAVEEIAEYLSNNN